MCLAFIALISLVFCCSGYPSEKHDYYSILICTPYITLHTATWTKCTQRSIHGKYTLNKVFPTICQQWGPGLVYGKYIYT